MPQLNATLESYCGNTISQFLIITPYPFFLTLTTNQKTGFDSCTLKKTSLIFLFATPIFTSFQYTHACDVHFDIIKAKHASYNARYHSNGCRSNGRTNINLPCSSLPYSREHITVFGLYFHLFLYRASCYIHSIWHHKY